MTTINLLIEKSEGFYQVTASDEYGEVAVARALNQLKAVNKAKRKAQEKLDEVCEFVEHNLNGD